jgi:hypothetical protein
MTNPKQLRKVTNNRIFSYTDALAALPDMVPVWAPGEEPEPEEQVSKGLEVNPKDIDRNVKKILREKDKIIMQLEKQLSVVGDENQKLHDQVATLETQWAAASEDETVKTVDPKTTDAAPHDNLTTEERMNILVGKTVEMLQKNDPNDFTGAGVPRVERLEAWAGIAEVTGQERTEAFEKAQEQLK